MFVAVNITDVYTTYFPVGQTYVFITCGDAQVMQATYNTQAYLRRLDWERGSKMLYTPLGAAL